MNQCLTPFQAICRSVGAEDLLQIAQLEVVAIILQAIPSALKSASKSLQDGVAATLMSASLSSRLRLAASHFLARLPMASGVAA